MTTFPPRFPPRGRSAVAVLAGGLVIAASACGSGSSGPAASGSAPGSTVQIGVDAALTGYLSASSDLPFVAGARIAVKEINAAGGADGHHLALDVTDDASTAGTGVLNATKLLTQTRVDVLMGGALSAQCAAVAPLAAAHQVPMTCIAPVPAQHAWTFQVAASLPSLIKEQALFAAEKLHAHRVAFLYSQTPYGQAGGKILAAMAPELGLTIVMSQGVDSSASDLTALMARVKSARPDAVLDFLTGPVHIVEAKGAAAAGLTVPIVQSTDTTNVARSSAQAYHDLYSVALPPQAYPQIGNAALAAANKTFRQAYTGNTDVVGQAAYGWDAVQIVAAAIRKSHAITGGGLRSAIEGLTYQGALSAFHFTPGDHTGEASAQDPNAILSFGRSAPAVVFSASSG